MVVENKSHSLIYAAVAFVIMITLVFLGLFWYFGSVEKNNRLETDNDKTEVPNTTLKIQTETNPVKKVPDLNPTEKTNPFKTKNPFE